MDLEVVFVILLLLCAVGAFLGSLIGKGVAGFWLSFFLGPIGWIIVFLLPRETPSSASTLEPPKITSLDNDEYRIWLVKSYQIQKNETLNQYECEDKLFDSVELALEYAHANHRDLQIEEMKVEMKVRLTSYHLPSINFERKTQLVLFILIFIFFLIFLLML